MAAGAPALAEQRVATLTSDQRADLRAGCNHYENRARFLSREGEIAFVTLMAEACAAAEVSLGSDSASERKTARRFLHRVLELRDTIIDMNMERVYGETDNPFAKPKVAEGDASEFTRVTDTGEFLIAHRMGVMSAYQAWLDSGASFSIAFLKGPVTP
ncbi:MAG: hypothetical protein AAGE80_10705 [Pseudomonadota bacterium]